MNNIEILEEMLNVDKHLGKFLSDNRRQAIENLIKENKELKERIMKLNNQNLGAQSYNEFFNK